MIRAKVNLADTLARMGDGARRGAVQAVRTRKKEILTAMAGRLEKHVIEDVFGKQASPRGVPWQPLSPLTLAIRRALGIGGNKAGIGPANAMINSFRIGGPGNHFALSDKGFTYGSDLRRKGHLVAKTFQEMFAVPTTEGNVEAKRERIRGFIFALTGWRSPGKGRHFAHLAREIIDLPMAWLKDLLDVAQGFVLDAALDGVTEAMRRAGIEVEAVRRRRPHSAGLHQFF